ncbi:flagellar motor switch protein FliM [Acidiphilium sp. AL]|uniref:Flagellar motor switch protein FliM n=1 Tax=Acidiphilium iwatense TaxID=768198 RepID=A0ABS9DSI3_9PROT|nr:MULTISPECIES: FliM/FliN family flagellar motor switch protein [Acidiphilium]MCF3945690.1 flagellar motor switch protein FliM [Acidiphilium iwatense]MCU4159507.1 flagellar motor switch protein FliM [Acidiphilium sp. AL]
MSERPESEPPAAMPLLGRDEIDAILEAGRDSGAGAPITVDRLIHGNAVSYERLPMADIVFEHLARILGGSLRNFIQDNVEVRLASLASQRLADSFAAIANPALLAVFRAREWDNLGVIVIESDMIYSLVEIMLGGRRAGAGEPASRKPLTSIERNVAERLVRLILHDLAASFAPLCTVSFDFERTETDPRFATIGRASGATLTARISLSLANRSGSIGIILPYATLEPVRELLLQQFMGEKFGRDSIWESHLAEELWHTDVELEAMLDEQTMSLGAVMAMREGDVMPIGRPKGSAILLRCGDVGLFTAYAGVRNGRIAAEIDHRLDRVVR